MDDMQRVAVGVGCGCGGRSRYRALGAAAAAAAAAAQQGEGGRDKGPLKMVPHPTPRAARLGFLGSHSAPTPHLSLAGPQQFRLRSGQNVS
eukprot:767860-Hanusia_phi.AAC.3